MIFALAGDGSTLFCLLSEKDVQGMRTGTTRFVDHHQIGEATFNRVVISLHKTDAEAMKLMQDAGHAHLVKNLVHPEPEKGEAKCAGCNGIMRLDLLFEGQCVCCWADQAKKARIAAN